MKGNLLSQYLDGVVAKRLSSVEANLQSSNQHEFNGVRALRELLGPERLQAMPARFVWLADDGGGLSETSRITWYDSRADNPDRSEYRLYFQGNAVMDLASEGDLLIVAKKPSGEITIIVVAAGSTAENQLHWLFDIREVMGSHFDLKRIEGNSDVEVGYAVRHVLDEIGIAVEIPEADRLDELLEPFAGQFPGTAEFSAFARDTLPDVVPGDDPDVALLAWIEQEEKLFRRLEGQIVGDRLKEGFASEDGVDIDGFISYSLSVHNRRKSRAGLALEHHLEEILRVSAIRFSRHARTENKTKPDFLFPGADEYHDPDYPSTQLTMLGAKSTCKDRWRQVLSEAQRIPQKHLLTLEPGISENQTNEMADNRLQLVLPRPLHNTYGEIQRAWLMDLHGFLDMVRQGQD